MIWINGATGALGNYLKRISGELVIGTGRELDITDKKDLKRFLKKFKPRVIIHLAGLKKQECEYNKRACVEINRIAPVEIFKMAQDYGCKKFIFPSTCAVYDQKELKPTKENENINPRSFYGAVKHGAEQQLIKECRTSLIILRIFNIYGVGFNNSLINKIVQGNAELINPDNYYRDYIHAEDVANIIRESVTMDIQGSNVINVGSGIPRSTREVLNTLKEYGFELKNKEIEGGASYSWADTTLMNQLFEYPISENLRLK